MRRAGTWLVAAVLLAAAGCEDEGAPAETISREAFVETYVALRVAQLRGTAGDPLPAEDRERVLAANGVTEEELLTFAEVHGPDVAFMEQLWEDVEKRLEEIRNTPDATMDPGDPAIPPP
ncbi:MAG: hypothetical protein F4139_06600 [Gemmatimonadetes bacterium]|nr:hypothetical protein [Gemmatimonadota bacterium]MYA64918.1 hypothetical protein [Gemmatimonadota bacterium]MYB98287.1 hypothetical protein [Gemmatimonadota bacterium]MYH52606.1 hypothetical protein [Gemmatimonadota bacterium]MYI45408.1 hypothetical protein [Gemmatimonadota bacterium]